MKIWTASNWPRRTNQKTLRLRPRQRPAALRQSGQRRRLPRRPKTRRHDPLARSSPRRPPLARPQSQHERPPLQHRQLRRRPPHRTIIDFAEIRRLAREHRPQLIISGLSAPTHKPSTSTLSARSPAKSGHCPHGRHRSHRRNGGRRAAPFAGALRRALRNLDDAQNSSRPACGLIMCKAEHAKIIDSRDFPRNAGRPAHARDRSQGSVLPDRGDRGLPRLPGPGSRQRRHAFDHAPGRRPRRADGRHRHAPAPARSPEHGLDR